MKQIAFFLSLLLVTSITSCSSIKTAKHTQKVDDHSSRNALDWAGNYSGTLEIGSMQTATVELLANETYTLKLYGDGTSPQTIKGKFKWNTIGSEVTLIGTPNVDLVLKVRENSLSQNGNNQLYKFFKDPLLMDQYWKLTEINGVSISTLPASQNEAYITFQSDFLLAFGSFSCNRFSGGYTVPFQGEISLGALASGRMMCSEMKIEDGFSYYLTKVVHYKATEKELWLLDKADGKILLKFQNVKMK